MSLGYDTAAMLQNTSTVSFAFDWSWALKAAALLGFIIFYCQLLWRVVSSTKPNKELIRYSFKELLQARKHQSPDSPECMLLPRIVESRPYAQLHMRGLLTDRRSHEDFLTTQVNRENFAARMNAPLYQAAAYSSSMAPSPYRNGQTAGQSAYSGIATPQEYGINQPGWTQQRTSSTFPGGSGRSVVTGAPYNPSESGTTNKLPSVTVGNPCLSNRHTPTGPRVGLTDSVCRSEPQREMSQDLVQTIRQLVSLISSGGTSGAESCGGGNLTEPNEAKPLLIDSHGSCEHTENQFADLDAGRPKSEDSTAAPLSARQNSPKVQENLQRPCEPNLRQQQESVNRGLASWITNQHPAPNGAWQRTDAIVIGSGVINEEAEDMSIPGDFCLSAQVSTELEPHFDVSTCESTNTSTQVVAALKRLPDAESIAAESENAMLELIINFKFLRRNRISNGGKCSLPAMSQLVGGAQLLSLSEIPAAANSEARAVLRGAKAFKRKEVLAEVLDIMKTHNISLETMTVRQIVETAEYCGDKDWLPNNISNLNIEEQAGEFIANTILAAKINLKHTLSVDAPEFTPMSHHLKEKGTEKKVKSVTTHTKRNKSRRQRK